MQENNQITGSIYFFSVLLRNWKFLLLFTLIGAIASGIIAFNLTVWYAASCNLVPSSSGQESSGAGGGSISSALKEFGLTSMKSSTSGEAYSYIVILNSRTVIDSIINKYKLDKVYDIPKSKFKKLREVFLDNVDVTLEKEGNYVITVWDTDKIRAAEIANDYVQIANNHFVNIFRQDNLLSKKYFEERIASLDSSISYYGNLLKKFSEKTLLFAPEEQAKSIAQSISEIKSEQIKYDILYEYYSKNFGNDDPLASLNKKLSNEFSQKLQNIQNQPGYAGNFSLSNATDVQVEYLRIFTEFETYSRVKAFLLPTIEKIKSDEIKQIQNLLIVDPAIAPDSKDKPKRAYIIAGSTFGSFILGIVLIFIFNYIKELKIKLKEIKQSVGTTK